MNANERELILKDEVYQIVGAAMEVCNQLGCGFLEAVYQEALEIAHKSTSVGILNYKKSNLTQRHKGHKEKKRRGT